MPSHEFSAGALLKVCKHLRDGQEERKVSKTLQKNED